MADLDELADPTEALEHSVRLLEAQFDRVPAAQIRELVWESYRAVAEHATVTAYLPLMAERRARAHLRGDAPV